MPQPMKFAVASLIASLSCAAQAAVLTPAQLGFSDNLSRDSLHAECKHVALIPVSVPVFTGVEPSASARIEAAGLHALQAAGFELISAESYAVARDRAILDAGGLYHPGTGAKRNDVVIKGLDAGLKALLSNPQIDCIAKINVERSKAFTANRYAFFNGAKEYVDGQANSTLTQIFTAAAGQGTLPSISLVMRIFDRNEKQRFGRFGGVQLTTYMDRPHGDSHGDYLTVPPETWLQDDKRLERAMTTITVPLRYTPNQIDAGNGDPKINTVELDPSDLPKPPPGLRRIDKPLLVPRDQILSSVHRVVIGTLTTHGMTSSPEVVARYQSLVHKQLASLGWEVIDSDQLNAAFGNAAQQVGGIYDRFTGKTDANRLKSLMHIALTSLGLPAMPDGVVQISLVQTGVTQVYGNVDWDGTQQSVLTLGPADDKFSAEQLHAGEGGTSAASFSFLLRDADGTLLVDSRGGIQLLQKLSIQSKRENGQINFAQTYTNLTLADLFTDPARDTHAVAVALHPLVAPSTVAAATK